MAESTRLESERTGNRTVGSNPTLSATPRNAPVSNKKDRAYPFGPSPSRLVFIPRSDRKRRRASGDISGDTPQLDRTGPQE